MKRNPHFALMAFLALIFAVLLLQGPATAGEIQEANPGRGGEPLDIKTLAVPGRTTVIEFYSPYCPYHKKYAAPLLEQVAQRRPDLVIKMVNINRPGVRGIDFKSPLAQQYQIPSVSHFMILNPEGKLVAEGKAADHWLQEARGGERREVIGKGGLAGQDQEQRAKSYLDLGNEFLQKRRYDEAIAYYNQALREKPFFPSAYVGRAMAFYYKGQYDYAWQDVRQAQSLGREIDPKFLKDLKKASGR